MSEYGIRLSDTAGKKLTLTPNMATVVAAGRATMPNPVSGQTYGVDIDLPGVAAIPEADISVMVSPTPPVSSSVYTQYASGGILYYNSFYMNSASAYYTRNESTGVVTTWTAGNRTAYNVSTWNPILAVCPVAFWDKMGATTFTNVRLFAGTAYMIRQPATDINYALSANGGTAVTNSDPTYTTGAASNTNDNNTGTYHQVAFYADNYTMYYTVTITWATSRDITLIDMVYQHGSWGYYGDSGNGKIVDTELYYGGAWHAIGGIDIGYYHNANWTGNATYTSPGLFNTGVTGIRISASLFAYYSDVGFRLVELRAWGIDASGTPNLIKYSLGSAGVPTVDYVVSVKKWNY